VEKPKAEIRLGTFLPLVDVDARIPPLIKSTIRLEAPQRPTLAGKVRIPAVSSPICPEQMDDICHFGYIDQHREVICEICSLGSFVNIFIHRLSSGSSFRRCESQIFISSRWARERAE
jgi:hypothetical protein